MKREDYIVIIGVVLFSVWYFREDIEWYINQDVESYIVGVWVIDGHPDKEKDGNMFIFDKDGTGTIQFKLDDLEYNGEIIEENRYDIGEFNWKYSKDYLIMTEKESSEPWILKVSKSGSMLKFTDPSNDKILTLSPY